MLCQSSHALLLKCRLQLDSGASVTICLQRLRDENPPAANLTWSDARPAMNSRLDQNARIPKVHAAHRVDICGPKRNAGC